MGQPSRDQSSILADLFPSVQQLTYVFVARRTQQTFLTAPTHDDLTPGEIDFITKCERRREHLRSLGDSDAQVQELKEMYSWEAFLRELRGYVAKNWEGIASSRGGKPRRSTKKRVSTELGFMDLNPVTTVMPQELPAPLPVQPPAPLPVQPTAPQQRQPTSVPTSVPTALHDPPSAVHIQEAYERARTAALPPTAVTGPAGANIGTSSIPKPSPSTAAQTTPRTAAEGNHLRRPWSKEEGTTYQRNEIDRLQKQHYSQVSKKSAVLTGQLSSNSTAPAVPNPKPSKTDLKSNSKTKLEI